MEDGRREAVEVGARPPSRAFWRRLEGRWSKERGGATGRSPALQKGGQEEPLVVRVRVLSYTRACLESESLFPEFLSSWSCARGLAGGLSTEARTGDAAAPVVWWTCAPGRGVPERVRQPRGRSEPGATKLTVGGERDSTATQREVLLFLIFVCMLWRLVREVETE